MDSVKRRKKTTESNDCKYCSFLDDQHREEITLTDKKLLAIYDGLNCQADSGGCDYAEERPQHRVTQFVVHDKCRTLCSFECGKIERGQHIYLCGVVLPICDEDENSDCQGLSTKMIGPLVEWWFAGFDGGAKTIIGVESQYASYILEQPLPDYAQLFTPAREKILLTKLVIETITNSPDSNYEELIEAIRERNEKFDEEVLLQHASFIIDQVVSYDQEAEADELVLSETQCFNDFVCMAGIAEHKKKKTQSKCHLRPIARRDRRRAINSDTLTASTPLVCSFFDEIFREAIDKDEILTSECLKTEKLQKKKPTTEVQNIQWTGKVIYEDKYAKKRYYSEVKINNEKFCNGEVVLIRKSSNDYQFGRIIYMFDNQLMPNREKTCHVQWLCDGKETILGETASDFSLFMTFKCEDIPIRRIENKICCFLTNDVTKVQVQSDRNFVCHKIFEDKTGRFEDLPQEVFDDDIKCCSCSRQIKSSLKPFLGPQISLENDVKSFEFVIYNEVKYLIEDCIKVSGEAFDMDNFKFEENYESDEEYDESIYTEKYRKKFSDYVKGSNNDIAQPLNICRILKIYKDEDSEDESDVIFVVEKFYRPPNVFENFDDLIKSDLNELFWSNEQASIKIIHIIGKCNVIYSCDPKITNYFTNSSQFYFVKCYDKKSKNLYDPPNEIICLFKEKPNITDETQEQKQKFNVLDIFAGCGGLALGFEMLEITSKMWAIEKDPYAAKSFAENFPSAIVFEEDANHFLDLAMKGKETNKKGQRLPRRGEVDLILGGPPCQGFSGMNRFSSRQYSTFKNSLIVSFLSFVDFYRPKYLLFENVKNFATFKKSMVLKLMLSCLVRMSYQCQFAIVQAGCYGVPQSRRRTVVIGALPGCRLPQFPQPTHQFSPKTCSLSVTIDDHKYSYPFDFNSAALRTITVRDAISDLPELDTDGDYLKDVERAYKSKAVSHFQKLMRANSSDTVNDHFCKELGPLVKARIELIPLVAGADWRDLPNIRHPLVNGIVAEKLQYNYPDVKNSQSSSGQLRGVCACASGAVCNSATSRQDKTLIPWCLVHTANRQWQWSGLYGRLSWTGYFPTTVTVPEPIAKQGRVLCPNQHRVISVREAARSQGFPDHFRLFGSVLDRYRQVGNAVPPPLAAAFARQFCHLTTADTTLMFDSDQTSVDKQ